MPRGPEQSIHGVRVPWEETAMAVNMLWLGAAGMGATVASIAHNCGFFKKHGVDVRLVPVTGTEIPELTPDVPFGFIGGPASLMRAAQGVDIRILASLDTARLSGVLVVRQEIQEAAQLRKKRLGARVTGAAMWIHTVLALEKLGLNPEKDDIEIAEVGDPADIVQALEARDIDGAVLARVHVERLLTKGFHILFDLFPEQVHGAPDALVSTRVFLEAHPAAAERIIKGLIEGTAFINSPREKPAALEALRAALNLSDIAAAENGLAQLSSVIARKPYPSVERLLDIQRIMLVPRPAVRGVSVRDVVDDRIVRKLDDGGFIDDVYREYGVA